MQHLDYYFFHPGYLENDETFSFHFSFFCLDVIVCLNVQTSSPIVMANAHFRYEAELQRTWQQIDMIKSVLMPTTFDLRR